MNFHLNFWCLIVSITSKFRTLKLPAHYSLSSGRWLHVLIDTQTLQQQQQQQSFVCWFQLASSHSAAELQLSQDLIIFSDEAPSQQTHPMADSKLTVRYTHTQAHLSHSGCSECSSARGAAKVGFLHKAFSHPRSLQLLALFWQQHVFFFFYACFWILLYEVFFIYCKII